MSESGLMQVTVEDAATLARFAGLTIAEDRLPDLAANLSAALSLLAHVNAIDISSERWVSTPFDPAWTKLERESTR